MFSILNRGGGGDGMGEVGDDGGEDEGGVGGGGIHGKPCLII